LVPSPFHGTNFFFLNRGVFLLIPMHCAQKYCGQPRSNPGWPSARPVARATLTNRAYMQWRRLGKLVVRVGLWCVDLPKTLPGSWLRLLIRIYAGLFLLRIILGLNHFNP
jgi:hypothetical protein